MVKNIIENIVDFVFPPNKEELKIREISKEYFLDIVKSAQKSEFPFIYPLFAYRDPLVRELIWQIKYKKNKKAIAIAGFALYSYLYKHNYKDCILIPIPISKERRKERGYNQTELIIDEIIKLDIENRFIKNYEILIREKNLDRQTLKNRKERLEAQGIFRANKVEDLLNKKMIIIDDVTTTGNTAKEAREAMLKVGFMDVQVVTLGH